jgi:predicted ATPase
VTTERVRQELTLQCSLGVQLAAQGSATPEVEHTYTRALELCQQVGDARELFPVLFGLSRFYKKRGKLQKADELGEQFLSLVQDQHDAALLLCGHYALGDALFWRGEFTAARAHLEQGIAFHNPRQHDTHAFLYEPDPALSCLGILSLTLWFLGYPDQALQRSHEALALAQASSHPYSLARALANAAALHALRREWQVLQERAEALQTLATAQGFAELLASATRSYGLALVEQGQVTEGIVQMQQSMTALQMLKTEDGQATHLAQLAKMYGRAGQAEEGLRLLTRAMAARQDTEERFDDVGRLRLKGELLLMLPHPDGRQAESSFRQALAVARSQQAKSLELRTALRLSRLWQQQGQREKARQLLAPIYGWFTEGFETADLQEARTLLAELW